MPSTVTEALRRANRIGVSIVNTASQGKLQQALTDFHQLLTPEEFLAFSSTGAPDASSVAELVSEIDRTKSKHGFRRLGPYFEPLLQSIQHFSGVVETTDSSNPHVAVLVWGSVKFVIIATLNFFGYFEKLAEMFRSIGILCPAFKELQELFPESAKLRESLLEFYAIVIAFCTEAFRFLKEKTIVQFGKSLWKSFQERFKGVETQLQEQREEINLQIQLASERVAYRGRQEVSLYQHKANQHRSHQIKQWEENRDWRIRKDTKEKDVKRKLLLEKISSYNYVSTFSKARSKRYGNTGLWLFDAPEFQHWDQDEKSCGLWCNGIPGSGKTILTAGTIDYLFSHRQGDTTSISYFFCGFADEQSQEVETILSSLIKQNLNLFDRIPPELEGKLDAIFFKNNYREPEVEELYQLLVSVTQLSAAVYILIDGLDECKEDNRRQLLFYLTELIRDSKSKVKVFISSRPELDISQSLGGFHLISLKTSITRSDIESYIHGVVDQRLRNRRLVIKQLCMVEEIKKALIQGSDGMFLWVTFQIEDICGENNDEDIREVLRSLPRGLNATYTRILGRIVKDRKPDIAKKVFRWLAVARRDLSLDELVQGISVKPGCQQYNENSFPTDKLRIIQNCGNLVTHDEQDNTVRFAHYTVLEFLLLHPTPEFLIRKSEANLYVGKVCLTYLSFPEFQTQISVIPKDPIPNTSPLDMPVSDWVPSTIGSGTYAGWLWRLAKRRAMAGNPSTVTARRFLMPEDSQTESLEPSEALSRKFHLAEYAANEWLFHCSEVSQDDEIYWRMFRALVFDRTLPLVHLPRELSEHRRDISGSYYAPYLKWAIDNDNVAMLRLAVKELETRNMPVTAHIEARTDIGHTLLQVASMKGKQSIIEALIDLGADVNASPASHNGRTALQAAAQGGHLVVVDRLLRSGAGVNASPAIDGGRTVLQAAAQGGHLVVVDRLLQLGADVNADPASHDGRTALQAAAEGGHLVVVDRLLQSGAGVNASPAIDGGRTVLQAAAQGGHLVVVDRLLQLGADVNADPASHDGRTALQAAAEGGHLVVVDRLLQSGADVNADPASHNGRTALQAAAQGGHQAVVDRLLQSGADVNASPTFHNGRTALQAAAGGGHLAVVDRLLQSGADVNASPASWDGRTALQSAAEGGHLAVVDRLLQSGADVNASPTFHNGRTALQAAAEGGHLAVVDRLLQSGADVNVSLASHNGRTALQAAAEGGHLAVVDRLLQLGADVNVTLTSRGGRTALQAAAEGGHLVVVDRLLRSGADVNANPAYLDSRTALQAAAEGGHLAVVDRLLQSGADVNASPASWDGRTALQAAAGGGHLAVVDRLLQSGADVNVSLASHNSRTALQAAAEGGHLAVVDRLLQSGADANASPASHNGRTALQAAAEGGHIAVVDRLLQLGADVNASPASHNGRTALQAARQGGHLAVVDRLLQPGAGVKAVQAISYNRTTLQAAAEGSQLVVGQPLQFGVDFDTDAELDNDQTSYIVLAQ